MVTQQVTCMWVNPFGPAHPGGPIGGSCGLGGALRPGLSRVCGWARSWGQGGQQRGGISLALGPGLSISAHTEGLGGLRNPQAPLSPGPLSQSS